MLVGGPRHGRSVRSGDGASPRAVAVASAEMLHLPIQSRTWDAVSAENQALSTELEDCERDDEMRGARGVR